MKTFVSLVFYSAIMLVSLCDQTVIAQEKNIDYQWKLKRDKQGIQIYTSKVDDSAFKAVRGVMTINASVTSLVALILDFKACADWADMCKESYEHEMISNTESYVYTYNNPPFPVADRDVLAHVIWNQDATTGRVSMISRATQGRMSKQKGAIRIKNAATHWHFTPTNDGKVLVENYAHVDPNGPVPAWIINRLLVNSPYKTLKNMRTMMNTGEYNNATVSWISDSTQTNTQ